MGSLSSFSSLAALKIQFTIPVSHKETFNLFLTPLQRNTVIKICMDVKKTIDWNFNFQEFHDILCKTPYPPLEFLWNLHVCQVLPLETYLLSLPQDVLNKFKLGMCELSLMDSQGDNSAEFVQTGMLSYFVNNAFDDLDREFGKISECIVNTVIRVILSLKKEDITIYRTRTLFSLWTCGTIEKNSLHKFCINVLDQFINVSSVAVIDVFAVQDNCYNKDNPFHLQIVLEKIIHGIKPSEVEQFLFDVILIDAINWKNYIVLVDVFIKTHSQASTIISKHVAELIRKAFQNSDQYTLLVVFLIVRQMIMALNPQNSYPLAYKQWFQTHFGDCQHLKHAQSFLFFVQVLSDLIPYESNIEIIKAALERTFNVPFECQSAYADYIALLKTRINDLEPHVQPDDIIRKLLLAYEEAGRIPSYILEASLMRKHYFLNEFLPVLLTPRVVPAFPDVKQKFIEELDRAGKIPSQMIQKYKVACMQEKKKLLAGINIENFIEEDS